MADQDNMNSQGGFPQNQTGGQSTYSTTGDGHPPRPGEPGYRPTQEGMAGQGTGQMGNTGTAGETGGYDAGTMSGSSTIVERDNTQSDVGGGMGAGATTTQGMGGSGTGGGAMGAGTSSRTIDDADKM